MLPGTGRPSRRWRLKPSQPSPPLSSCGQRNLPACLMQCRLPEKPADSLQGPAQWAGLLGLSQSVCECRQHRLFCWFYNLLCHTQSLATECSCVKCAHISECCFIDRLAPSVPDSSSVLLGCRCGSSEGLDAGRHCLQKWGFRRCEDICWIKTNAERGRKTASVHQDAHSTLQHTKVRAPTGQVCCLTSGSGCGKLSCQSSYIRAPLHVTYPALTSLIAASSSFR